MMPKIGLALGSGAARGGAHIGVLKVLEREGIQVSAIAGTSVGALVGALYASGMSAVEIEQVALTLKWKKLIDFRISQTGLVEGTRIERYIRKLLKGKQFSEMRIPLSTVAADIANAQKVVFCMGDVAQAVRASISIPAVFRPLEIKDRLFVDGGIMDPVPVEVVKGMGADIVIAVDLSMKDVPSTLERERSVKTRVKKKLVGFLKKLNNLFVRQVPETVFVRMPKFIARIIAGFVRYTIRPDSLIDALSRQSTPGMVRATYMSIAIMSSELAREKLKRVPPDVLIRPDIGGVRWTDFDSVDELIELGEKAAEKHLPEIRRLITENKTVVKK